MMIYRTLRTWMVAALAAVCTVPAVASAQNVTTKDNKPMKNLVQVAVEAGSFNTLVAAVKAAGLVDTLAGPGPFTVFAPTDAAFAKLPKGTVEALVKPDMKPKLTEILTYHVVPGRLTAAELLHRAKAMGGKAELKTVEGGTLTVTAKGRSVYVTDAAGNTAKVETADVLQKNGVVHVID